MNVTLAATSLGLFFYVLYRLARWAKKQSVGAFVLEAFIMPFGLGNMTDPEFKAVQQAELNNKKEEDDPGDPVNDDEG
jgi:hypothetical protein